MSVTFLSFDGRGEDLVEERHGSLHVDDIRGMAAAFGVTVRLRAAAANRLPMRTYPT